MPRRGRLWRACPGREPPAVHGLHFPTTDTSHQGRWCRAGAGCGGRAQDAEPPAAHGLHVPPTIAHIRGGGAARGQAVAGVPRTQSRLLRMVGTLEGDLLRTEGPASLEALERLAEGSSSQLLYLQV